MENNQPSKIINIALWVAQILLAGLFFMAGYMKSTTSIEQLSISLPWAKDVPELLVRFIGTSEFLGAMGLLLPSLLRIKPFLTPVAASGILLIMLMALIFHITRGEYSGVAFTLILGLAAAFIAWGRYKLAPVRSKNG